MQLLEKTALGSTGIEVSRLGLGTVKFGRNQGVKYPAGFELPDDRQVRSLLAAAGELGINLLDTAPAYGTSEERLGQLISTRPSWTICTKVGEEFHNGQSSFDFSARHVIKSVERSLARLRTDYLDIVLVHSNGDDMDIIEGTDCLDALSGLKQAGKIRSYGISTKTVDGGLLAVERCDLVMVTYNPVETADGLVIDRARELGKGILVKKGLASGHLDSLSAESNPIHESLRFIFSRPGVDSVIVGTIDEKHLRENVATTQQALAGAA